MAVEHVDDELWNEFHRVVNMTSHELRDWLMTRSAGEDGEVEPGTQGGVGTPTGQEVLHILGKRRTDLTADDGPEAFPGLPCALVSGRHLTWYGPSLAEAPRVLGRALRAARP